MKRLLQFKWSLLFLSMHIVVSIYYYISLPEEVRIPMHWNAAGEIDGYASKPMGILLMLGVNLFLLLFNYLMPWFSPWYKKHAERFERIIPRLTAILILFFGLIGSYSLWLAKHGVQESGINVIMVLLGLLMIMIGNILPKAPRNFFIGIRTPWTLASDEVWKRTHRLGAWLFVFGGLILALKGMILLQNRNFQIASTVIAFAMLLLPIPYSLVIYKGLKIDKAE